MRGIDELAAPRLAGAVGAPGARLVVGIATGLAAVDRIRRDVQHGAVQQPVSGKMLKLNVSTLISPGWPVRTKPMSRFCTIASISSRLSRGTTSSSA